MSSTPDTPTGMVRFIVGPHGRLFVAAVAFSFVINLAMLAPSVYMLQVFDRVLSTRSPETLVMLSLFAGAALLLMWALDLVRGRLLALTGLLFEDRVGAQVLGRVLDGIGRAPVAQQAGAMRDVTVLRGFVSGPGLVALFDAPWMLMKLPAGNYDVAATVPGNAGPRLGKASFVAKGGPQQTVNVVIAAGP